MLLRIVMRALAPLSMACLVSGCNPAFVESSQPHAATVTFRNESPGFLVFHKYSDNERCTDPQGITNIAPQKEFAVKVDVPQVTTFSAGYMNGNAFCNLVGSFVAKPDRRYMVLITADTQKCYIAVFNGSPPSEENVEKSFVGRDYKQPILSKSEGFCAALDEKSRQVLDSAL